jgi:hypothetical protein
MENSAETLYPTTYYRFSVFVVVFEHPIKYLQGCIRIVIPRSILQ